MNEAAQVTANPALGVVVFVLGGFAGAVFYLPFRKVKNWAWESYWLMYAIFGLVIVPWLLALLTSPNVTSVLWSAPRDEILYCFLCGAAWGIGGLTWGLMIRYLGMGLGLAIGCGVCSAAGTLIPKALKGEFAQLFQPGAGLTSFVGVAVSLVGIVLVGMAGRSKERELPDAEKKKAVAEFDFKKGIVAALFSGLMSSAMNFGLSGGGRIQKLAVTTVPATTATWSGMPVLVVVLLGGFAVNALWCLYLNVRNRTAGDYVRTKTPLVGNLVFAGMAGAIWCSQFICLKAAEPAMGETAYVGWAVLMASSILFSALLGIFLGEWRGTSGGTRAWLACGLALLLGSALIAGYGGRLALQAQATDSPGVELTHVPELHP